MARRKKPLAFEVWKNGKKLCVAGIEDGDGVLSAILSWVGGPKRVSEASLHVGGLEKASADGGEHLQWASAALRAGDEITVRVRDGVQLDEPKKRYRLKAGAG